MTEDQPATNPDEKYIIKKVTANEEEKMKSWDQTQLQTFWERETILLIRNGHYITEYISPTKDTTFQDKVNQIIGATLKAIEENPKLLETPIHNRSYASDVGTRDVSQGADPVDLFNGNFVYNPSDFQIIGAGIDFVFTRTYSQLSCYSGPLGWKWDHCYNLWLRVKADHNIIYRSNGRLAETIYRRHNTHDYWLAEFGEDGIITERDNGFVWRSFEGVEYHYSPHVAQGTNIFLVEKIVDRFGNKLQFQYDQAARLSKVMINNPQRYVIFHYDDRNRISAICDFLGRCWHYAFDDFDDLVAVTTPATKQFKQGLTTYYEYSTFAESDFSLQHNIIAIADSNGQIYLANEYGSNPSVLSYNRVVRQRQGTGETLFEYEDVIEDFIFHYQLNEQPVHQTIVTERNGNSVRYLFNNFGNKIFEERYTRINGLPKLVSTHYRYNKDGNLIGTISPEGVITQFLYGRDYYERKTSTSPDYRDIDDQDLDFQTRQSFNHPLATVKRGKYYSIISLNLSQGIWADIFPDIYDISDEDIVQKFTYESDYGQPLTISDPRYTHSANPDFAEPQEYTSHLTRYTYTPSPISNFHVLHTIESPSITYPDGTISGPVTNESTFDENGRVLENIGPENLVTRITYYDNTSGPLEGFLKELHIDPAHLSIKIGYERDQLGRVTRTHLPKSFDLMDGRFVTETEYNELDQVLSVTSTLPFKYRLERKYSRLGNITEESFERKNSDGSSYDEPFLIKTYDYDEEFHVVKTTVGNNQYLTHKKSRNTYDSSGRLSLIISPSSRKFKLYYNERSLVTKEVIDHGGIANTVRKYYDGDGRLIRDIDPNGVEESFVYDTLGRLIEHEDALRNKRLFTYDKLGNLIIERFFEIHSGDYRLLYRIEHSYDELGRRIITRVNEFEGPIPVTGNVRNAFLQHGPGELLTSSYFYDKNGLVTKITDPSDREFNFEYDKLGQLTKRTDPYGNEINKRYDKHGNVIRSDATEVIHDTTSNGIISNHFFAATFIYDELDRLITSTDSLGNQTYYNYNSLNQLVSLTDPLSNKIESNYDIFGRIIQTNRFLKDHTDTITQFIVKDLYLYDLDDFLIQKMDPLGRITKFEYDSMGRLASTVLPDGSRDFSHYDRSSRIILYGDRNGLLHRYQRDPLGRLLTIQIDDTNLLPGFKVEGSRFTNYQYDGAGRVIFCENEYSRFSFNYNSLGWLMEENHIYIHPENSASQRQFNIIRHYNNNGVPTEIRYPSGRIISYKRDILDRIISIEQKTKGLDFPGDIDTLESSTIMNVEYEGLRRKRMIRPNQTSTEYLYDRGSRMIEIKHNHKGGLLSQLQYLYDAAGNMRQKTERSSENNITSVFHYDSLYRIREVSKATANFINSMEFLSPPTVPLPDPIPHTQSEINILIEENIPTSDEYTYDVVGSRLTKKEENQQVEQYVTNDLDQYSHINGNTIKYDKMGNLIEDEGWEYRYSHNNQLSSIMNKGDNNEKMRFYYDPLGRKIQEIQNNQSLLLVYDGWNIIEEYNNNDIKSSIVADDGMDNLIQVSTNNSNFWCYSDIIKSITYIMKADEKNQYFGYDEFGRITTQVQDGIVANRFTGKRFIPEIGKYDFIFRTYDPKVGRFLQRDPRAYKDGSNLYVYASNNPLSSIDPFGTDRHDRHAGANEISSSETAETTETVPVPEVVARAAKSGFAAVIPEKVHEWIYLKEANDEIIGQPSGWSKELQTAYYADPVTAEIGREYWDKRRKEHYKSYLSKMEEEIKRAWRVIDGAAFISKVVGGVVIAAGVVFGGSAALPTLRFAAGRSVQVYSNALSSINYAAGRLMQIYATVPKVYLGVNIVYGMLTPLGAPDLPGPIDNVVRSAVAPLVQIGDVKSVNSYPEGLKHLAEMEGRHVYEAATAAKNTALALYDSHSGEVILQVFGPAQPGQSRKIIWEGVIGSIPIPPGLTPIQIGNAVEEPVRDLVRRATGQNFPTKASNAHGPDLTAP